MLSLLNLLARKAAVELDNHIDVELLLLAAYQLYDQRFNAFTSWEQRDAFCIRVIGLIQSALSPETAKIFCEGLYNVVDRNQQVGERAAALKLFGGESFYRASRESLSGLAGKYLCDGGGRASRMLLRRFGDRMVVTKLMSNKNIKLAELMQPRQPELSTGCVIC